MRDCGYWGVCAGLLVPQLGCWRRLDFDTAWVPPDALNPSCLPSDVPSTDASEACNVYTGVVRFFSSTPSPSSAEDPVDYDELSQSYDRFRGVVGHWVLARK